MADRPKAERLGWVASLRPADAARARRWIKEVGGEAAFYRIAAALPPRPEGRPKESPESGIAYAARLYVTNPGMSQGDAAGATRKHFTTTGQIGSVTPAAFRRRVSEALRVMTPEAFRAVAIQARSDGLSPRADLFPDMAIPRQATLKQVAKMFSDWPLPLKRIDEQLASLVAFMKAFEIPDNMPIGPVAEMHEQVRLYVREGLVAIKEQSAANP